MALLIRSGADEIDGICRCVPMSFVNGVGTDVLYCDKELGQRGDRVRPAICRDV